MEFRELQIIVMRAKRKDLAGTPDVQREIAFAKSRKSIFIASPAFAVDCPRKWVTIGSTELALLLR